jgi:hypothetical protein
VARIAELCKILTAPRQVAEKLGLSEPEAKLWQFLTT